MAVNNATALALAASRIKIFFAAWQPSSEIGVTAARSAKHRFVKVGFEDQIPRRLSLHTEYFNADVFFTNGPLKAAVLLAFERQDRPMLERLLMVNLFTQGPAYWQSGNLKPNSKGNLPEAATVQSKGDNFLFWSGLDTQLWMKIADTIKKANPSEIDELNKVITEGIHLSTSQV